jgi:3-deoxy-7-phosphoheptulonate synthase
MLFSFYLSLFFLPSFISWNPTSWASKKIYQDVSYPNDVELNNVINELNTCSPLIFAGEANSLKNELIKVSKGEAFLLMGGDCAETFRDFSVNNVMNTYRVLLQMTLIFMYGMSKPVVKIGRIAGQYAKPRSEQFETIYNKTLYAYRGDIINSYEFEEEKRIPNPRLMLKAYSYSVQTMNLIRALSEGGYADIERIEDWNLNFVKFTESSKRYEELSKNVNKALQFLKSIGIDKIEESKRARFYTAHESLLLPYESALTRQDSISNKYYACSAHMLWIGERTRQLDGAHVEYASGLENPIGIKISENCRAYDLQNLIRKLNPNNEEGKIVLIVRMGKKIDVGLPPIVYMIQKKRLNVVWISDPMHGNTVKLEHNNSSIKTRYIEDIKEEYRYFRNYLVNNNIFPGGVHLEMTGKDVTECVEKKLSNSYDFLHYESTCDPRLSAAQCLDLAFYISSL